MKYTNLVLWTLSLFLLMFSSFPFRVECRPTRAMGPGPPKQVSSGGQHLSIPSSSGTLAPINTPLPNCPVLEGPSALRFNPWPELYRPDITVKVWDTPIVLEGTARSRSEVRPDGTYGVTFDLHRVVKGDAPLLRRRKQFRLQFLDNPSPLPDEMNPHQQQQSKDGSRLNHNSNNRNNNNNRQQKQVVLNSLNNYGNASSTSGNSNSKPRLISSSSSSSSSPSVNLHSNSRNTPSRSLSSGGGVGINGGGGGVSTNSVNGQGIITSRQLHQPQNQIQLYRHQQQQQLQLRNLQQQQQPSIHRQQQLQQQQQHQQQFQQTRQNRIFQNSSISAYNSRTNAGAGGTTGRRTGRNVPQNSFSPRSNTNLRQCLPPKATVKTGRKYYVFAAKVDNHFIAVYSPELANKRNTKQVESILCKGCGQAPSVVAAKDVQLKVKERLRLRCRLRAGNPVPVLTWYKDGRPVNLTDTRFRLRPKRRQSILVIRKAKEIDAGIYKCEAKNAFGSAHAIVRVTLPSTSSSSSFASRPSSSSSVPSRPLSNRPSSSKPVGTTPTTLWPLASSKCPYDSYCLNGGTCSYYATIGEYVCQCAEGYKGQRCDTKDIPTSGSMYLSYFCIFGTNNPDYPC